MGDNQYSKTYANNKLWKLSGGNWKVRACVVFIDFVIINLLMLFALWDDSIQKEIPKFFHSATKISVVVMNFSMVIAQYFFHTVIDRRILTAKEVLVNVIKLVICQVILMGVGIRVMSDTGGLFRFMVIFAVVEFVIILVSRYLEREIVNRLRLRGRNSRSVLFVGNDPIIKRMFLRMTESPTGGYRVLGYYSDKRIKDEPEGLKWLGDMATLNRTLDKWNNDVMSEPNVDELFCSMSHDEEEEIRFIMHACDRNIIHFFYVPRTFGNEMLHLRPVMLDNYVYYSNRIQPLLVPENRFIKRAFDVCFSLVVCIFLVPLTLIVGLIIKLQSPGPIFFKQARTGLDGKDFYCYKFRSMHVNKDADTAQATKDDPRKFPFGNFMRKTNIDELPQFFNVLKGDMSIVGPRPHMLHHTEMYGKLIDNYMVRLFCKPGITGYAQVTGYRGETKELWQMQGRIERDIWYVEHWSLGLDLKIIVKTFTTFFVHDKNAF